MAEKGSALWAENRTREKNNKSCPRAAFFRAQAQDARKESAPRRNDMKEKDPKKNGAFRKERAGFGFAKKVMHLLLSRV